MEPLRTLVFAGLRKDKGTFIGLALLLFLAGLALTLTTSLFVDLSEREETLLDKAGAGDVFANDLVSNLTDEDVEEIEALPEVGEVKVTEAFVAPTRVEDARGNETVKSAPPSASAYEAWGSSLVFSVLADDLLSYRDAEGGPADDEVYVRVAEHTLHNMQIGDRLVLDIGGRETSLRVAGFYEDPQLGTPFMETKRYLLSTGTFEKLLAEVEKTGVSGAGVSSGAMSMEKEAYPIREINVMLTPEARSQGIDSRGLTQLIDDGTSWGASAHTMFSRQTLSGYSILVVQVITAVLAVFALILFVVALILCLHTASSSIQSGYADWGVLKGVGLSRNALCRVLVMQYALAAFAGLALGFVGGLPSGAALLADVLAHHGNPRGRGIVSVGGHLLLCRPFGSPRGVRCRDGAQDRTHHAFGGTPARRRRHPLLPARGERDIGQLLEGIAGMARDRI